MATVSVIFRVVHNSQECQLLLHVSPLFQQFYVNQLGLTTPGSKVIYWVQSWTGVTERKTRRQRDREIKYPGQFTKSSLQCWAYYNNIYSMI